MTRVAIIGAGVLGASVAHHLAGRAEVVLIDAGEVGGGTSARSYARLSAWGKQPDSYFRLNHEGMRAHAALAGEWYHRCGTSLTGCAADRAQAERLGYTVEPVNGDTVFLPEEGWVDAPLFARSLAASSGAAVLTSRPVTSLRPGWEVGFADGSSLSADVVVNTAGIGAARVAAMAGHALELVPSRGALLELGFPGHPLTHIVHTDDVTIRPVDADRLLVRAPSGDTLLTDGIEAVAAQLLALAAKLLPWLDMAEVCDVRVGERVIPASGLPSVGAVDGLDGYLYAVAHSGVILAPVIGRQLVNMII